MNQSIWLRINLKKKSWSNQSCINSLHNVNGMLKVKVSNFLPLFDTILLIVLRVTERPKVEITKPHKFWFVTFSCSKLL